jgi:DNA invertase Pin-like site-specific DNA recombinase
MSTRILIQTDTEGINAAKPAVAGQLTEARLAARRIEGAAAHPAVSHNILHQLAEKGAKFKSLHDPWCDTSTPQGELLVTILAGFATFERHLIKARTDDGRKRAQARGVRFGRPRKLDAHQRKEALDRLAKGETLVDVARTFGVDPTTNGRLQSPFVPGSVAA